MRAKLAPKLSRYCIGSKDNSFPFFFPDINGATVLPYLETIEARDRLLLEQ